MTRKQSESRLRKLISSPMGSMGFHETKHLCYIRGDSERCEKIHWGGRLHQGVFYFDCWLGIRFGNLAKILCPGNTDVSMPTIMTPLHFLHKDRSFFEWRFGDPAADELLGQSVLAELREYALPFFQRFRTLDRVEASLRSSNPVDHFALDPEQRLAVVAAIASVRGANDEALRILEKALALRQDAVPAKRFLLEDLRTQIVKRVASGGRPPSGGDEAR